MRLRTRNTCTSGVGYFSFRSIWCMCLGWMFFKTLEVLDIAAIAALAHDAGARLVVDNV